MMLLTENELIGSSLDEVDVYAIRPFKKLKVLKGHDLSHKSFICIIQKILLILYHWRVVVIENSCC